MNLGNGESIYDNDGRRHFINRTTGQTLFILDPITGDIYDEHGKWIERDIDFLY